MIKISILHFQAVEKYPPVMNLINSINDLGIYECDVYSTHNIEKNWFFSFPNKIHRIASISLNPFLRYWGYCKFNIVCFFKLLFNKPSFIIVYETYSVLPAFFYKKIFPEVKVHIHYHEYTSTEELKRASYYYKILNVFEKKLFVFCNSISHTNSERINLFAKDYANFNFNKLLVIPNIPPKKWFDYSKLYKNENKSGIIRLIHVGSVGLESMYVSELVNWIIAQEGKYSIDFYTNNISNDAKAYLESLGSNYIHLFGSVNYFELPKILVNYDIGITIYKGLIPNHVYSVPNKIFEYLACGLEVWYSYNLVSTDNLNIEKEVIAQNLNLPFFLKKFVWDNKFPEPNYLLEILLQD